MNLRSAATATLKSRRFWIWQLAGVVIYAIPAAIRFSTGSIVIPFLNFPGFWIGHFIPGNFLEKLIVNSFFPGGAGGIAGEVFFGYCKGKAESWRAVYLRRLVGVLVWTAAWSAFQFFGYYLFIMGPYGSNIFEHVLVFPINFVLACISIFTPDWVGFLKSKLVKLKKLL
ncbi:MAG: hypothetical protein NWF00_01190 [Candidatus Bathyarchaeota archaeon]|nr:hypothetical protein [Candidatus Bathyarchaeota archaeon]